MKDYVVLARTDPTGKIINKEHSHGEDKEAALDHLIKLKRRGWRAEIILKEDN